MCFPLVWMRLELSETERSMLRWLASFALFCLCLGLFSTVVMDRLNYYAVPFQIAIFCRLPSLAVAPSSRAMLGAAIALPFVTLLAAWLLLTDSNRCMDPYRSYLSDPGRLLGAGASTDYQLYHDPFTWEESPHERAATNRQGAGR
jgi:hypothetical protein